MGNTGIKANNKVFLKIDMNRKLGIISAQIIYNLLYFCSNKISMFSAHNISCKIFLAWQQTSEFKVNSSVKIHTRS